MSVSIGSHSAEGAISPHALHTSSAVLYVGDVISGPKTYARFSDGELFNGAWPEQC